jgi:ABC-type sugar transport system substrate-binding protein
MSRTIAYVMPLPPGAHPGMDAVAHGIAAGLAPAGAELRILVADLRDDFRAAQARAVREAVAAGVAGIVVFVLDEQHPAEAVAAARAAGIPVVTVHKPAYEVTASVVVPNFYHGVWLTQFLARHLAPRPRVALVGGPHILDDEELVAGLLDGGRRAGFDWLNDPLLPEYRNADDVKGGATALARRFFDRFPDMDALVVFNDETLHDFLPELAARGLTGRLPVVSRNGSPFAVEAVRRGESLATYDYGLPEMGRAAGALLARLLDGATVPVDGLVCPTPGTLIHAENAAGYQPWQLRAEPLPLRIGLDP